MRVEDTGNMEHHIVNSHQESTFAYVFARQERNALQRLFALLIISRISVYLWLVRFLKKQQQKRLDSKY